MIRSDNKKSAERGMRKLVSLVLPNVTRRDAAAAAHPDPDLLAAFAEHRLSRPERDTVLAHLAACSNCRAVLALASSANQEEAAYAPAARRSWKAARPWCLAAAAALLFMAIAAPRLFTRSRRPPAIVEFASPQQVAPTALLSSDTAAHPIRTSVFFMRPGEKQAWNLDPSSRPGAIRKSGDGGKTWRTVPIDAATHFYALSAAGSDIWAGGSGGRLFHSANDGANWKAVPITTGNTRVSQPIIHVESSGSTIMVKTASGTAFVSNDAGKHWLPQ